MLIVEYPVVQSIAMALGLVILALEYPLPIFKPWAIHRSFFLRIVLLSLQFFFGTLYYQVRRCGYTFPRHLTSLDLGCEPCNRVLGSDNMLHHSGSSPRKVWRGGGGWKSVLDESLSRTVTLSTPRTFSLAGFALF